MEAIGAGASVLAFVTLGLKSAKVIHEVLSSFKDGSKTVEQTARDVSCLQSTLERLARCRIVAECPDQALTARIELCADDMKGFAEKLKKLAISEGPGLERQWKRLKVFLNEKDLGKMSAVVAGHTAGLNLHLQVLESDALFEVKDAVRQGLAVQHALRDGQSTIVAQQTTMIHSFRDTMTRITEDTHLICNNTGTLRDEARSVHDTVHAAMEGSASRHSETIHLLKQLSEQISGLALKHASESRVVEEVDDNGHNLDETTGKDVLPNDELFECINSILRAIRDKEGIFAVGEAKDIADALLLLLSNMTPELSLITRARSVPTSPWFEACTEPELSGLRQNLMAVQGIIMSTRSLSVNKASRLNHRLQSGEMGWSIVDSHYSKRSHDLTFGVLSVTSVQKSRKTWRTSATLSSTSADGDADILQENKTHISFIPKLDTMRHGFQAVLGQSHDDRGTFNSIPRLLVNNILPVDSPVFAIVKEGRLVEFQEMLMSRKASLRDHDEYGASLLLYANRQPNMCRFLLHHGAEVDHVASLPWWSHYHDPHDDPRLRTFTGTALETCVNDDEFDEDTFDQVLECRKLLLDHGCDPMTPSIPIDVDPRYDGPDDYNVPMCWETFRYGDMPAMRTMLDRCSELINTAMFTNYGTTPLILHCSWARYTVESLSYLLSRGADIRARDVMGETCLHKAFGHGDLFAYGTYRLTRIRSALAYLIRHGADIAALDNEGKSVSEVAYERYNFSSVSGDLWDLVLADCGYDVAQFRTAGHPRKARYRENYTRQVFEELWRGQEHLCPYYYDEEPAAMDEETSESESDEENDPKEEENDASENDLEDCSSDEEDGGGCILEEPSMSQYYNSPETLSYLWLPREPERSV